MCQDEYYQFPKWLLEADLNNTERIVYMLILDRARLSQRSGYHKGGNCYGIITNREMSEKLKISDRSARKAIKTLKESGLVETQNGKGICLWIFPKLPDGSFAVPRNKTSGDPGKIIPRPRKKSSSNAPGKKVPTIKNEMINNDGVVSPKVEPTPPEEVKDISPEEAAARFRAILGEEWM